MKAIPTTIVGHLSEAKCSLTGKDKTECFVVRVGKSDPQNVSVARLIEVLRWNCSINIGEPETERKKIGEV